MNHWNKIKKDLEKKHGITFEFQMASLMEIAKHGGVTFSIDPFTPHPEGSGEFEEADCRWGGDCGCCGEPCHDEDCEDCKGTGRYQAEILRDPTEAEIKEQVKGYKKMFKALIKQCEKHPKFKS